MVVTPAVATPEGVGRTTESSFIVGLPLLIIILPISTKQRLTFSGTISCCLLYLIIFSEL